MRTNHHRLLAGLATAAMITATLAGCGGDDKVESATAGLEGEPIKLMSIVATGTSGQNYPDYVAAAEASVRSINAKGGLDGRPLELLYCNENNDAAAAEECARKAVSEDVVAVVAYSSARGGQAVHDILDAASIPIVAGQMIVEADQTSAHMYSVDGGVVVGFSTCPAALAEAGAEVQGFVHTDVDSAAALEPLVSAGITGAGAEDSGVVIKVPSTATDFSGFVRTLQDKGVQGVTAGIAEPLLVQLLQTIDQLGADIKVCSTHDASTDETLRGLGEAASNYFTAGLPPAAEGSTIPGVDEYLADMKAQEDAGDDDAKLDKLRTSSDMRAWVGPRLVQRVASTIEGDITGASLIKAFSAQDALDADMFGAIDFTKPGALQPAVRNYDSYLSRWDADKGAYALVQEDTVDALTVLSPG
jgi:ABC-type branched-subunit amino acid transport system substrate-binding protein